MKNNKLILVVMILLVIIVGMVAYYLYQSNSQMGYKNINSVDEGGEDRGKSGGFEQLNTAIVGVDNKEVSKGAFDKVEGTDIYFQDDRGKSLKLPLAGEELSFMCTNQDLETTQEMDFDQVVGVEVIHPSFISQRIGQDSPIMILANAEDGVFKAHTIVANIQDCQ